jgi:hypothetical protein
LRSFLSSTLRIHAVTTFLLLFLTGNGMCSGLASNNIPLDSPIYTYLEKLAGLGLISGDIKGVRPYSKSEAARLTLEAERNLDSVGGEALSFAGEIIRRIHDLIPRELSLYREPGLSQWFDFNPMTSSRLRYVYLDGVPRSYERPVNDPGGDGVFGIGSGLRPDNPFPTIVHQHGTEGTPLMENNEGIHYQRGHNTEFRFSGEIYGGGYMSALVEPLLLYSKRSDDLDIELNKGYIKLGGGGLELEVGRDSNWLGIGHRTAITLSDNAKNFDIVKFSSPEPLNSGWVKRYLGEVKYSLIFSRFERTITNGAERQPYFFGGKLSVKPMDDMEVGINLGRQVGGPGVSNGLGEIFRGLIGGTSSDNSNSVAGIELRFRIPFLRNSEIYGEYSGEDSAAFWPIVESYVAGIYIPCITADGRNDFRFEYYLGNAILSTNGTFPEGYLYHGMNIGPSQGGAAQEFFFRFSHWFSVRNNLALEYLHTERGNLGRVKVNSDGEFDEDGTLQAKERKDAVRAFWNLPLYGETDLNLMYGWEDIHNLNLVGGDNRTNQIFKVDISYRY